MYKLGHRGGIEKSHPTGGTAICDVALDKYEEAWEKAVRSWCFTMGDLNLDDALNGQDIAGFTAAVINPADLSFTLRSTADMNGDGEVTVADIENFVNQLLGS